MRRRFAMLALAGCLALPLVNSAGILAGQSAPVGGLSGIVTSAEEGPMEGVLVWKVTEALPAVALIWLVLLLAAGCL